MAYDPHLILANRLFEAVIGIALVAETWGYYAAPGAAPEDIDLTNKARVIWLCSLVDVVEATQRFLPDAIVAGAQSGFADIVHNGEQLRIATATAADLIEQYDEDEQLFLSDLRNQWVHGYFANRSRDVVTVKLVRNGAITIERMVAQDYHARIYSISDRGGTLDDVLKALLS